MKKFIHLTIILCLLAPSVAAQSLFFTAEETARIDATIAAEPPADLTAYRVQLDAILYVDEARWTIWLNDRAYRPETQDDRLRILSVTPDRVVLRVGSPLGQNPRHVTLRPRQSLNLLTGEISQSQ